MFYQCVLAFIILSFSLYIKTPLLMTTITELDISTAVEQWMLHYIANHHKDFVQVHYV